MKKMLLILTTVFMLTGCSTIAHKDVNMILRSGIIDVDYKSTVAIPTEMIPQFIKAVDKLEKLLKEE